MPSVLENAAAGSPAAEAVGVVIRDPNIALPLDFQSDGRDANPDMLFRLHLRFSWRAGSPNSDATLCLRIAEGGLRHVSGLLVPGSEIVLSFDLPRHKLQSGRLELRLDVETLTEGASVSDILAAGDLMVESMSIDLLDVVTLPKRQIIAAAEAISAKLFQSVLATGSQYGNSSQLIEMIEAAIRSKTPLCVTRYGDGEGRILAYPHLLSEYETLRDTVQYMFGRSAVELLTKTYGADFLIEAMRQLGELLRFSIRCSDVVGLPTPNFFRRELDAGSLNGALGFAGALLHGPAVEPCANIKLFVDTFIFKHLFAQGLFDRLLNGLNYLGLVAHSDLGPLLCKRFNITAYDTTVIPGHHSFMPSQRIHYPREYEAIARSIKVPHRGAVVLVAAGYLGKYYCAIVKQRGGIALDIGSIFDSWSGKGRADCIAETHLRLRDPVA